MCVGIGVGEVLRGWVALGLSVWCDGVDTLRACVQAAAAA
eukprot:COSAG01_NODE_1134_length_11558_cov_8.381360_5_plen_40_part_00